MTNWDLVVSGEELDAAAATRKQTEEKVSISRNLEYNLSCATAHHGGLI